MRLSWRRLQATVWARSLEFVRDRAALGWNLAFPILLIAGMAWIFSGPGQPLMKVAVLTEAPAERTLDAQPHPFLDIPEIQFYREPSLEAAIGKVQRQRVDLLLDLRAPAPRYWVNEDSPKGRVAERLLLASGGAPLARVAAHGAGERYSDWLLPGVLGMNMMWACLFGIGYVIVRYRKNGYLKRLKATPLTALEFILAQLISRLGLILLANALVFVAVDWIIDVRMIGSYLLLAVVATLGAVAMTAMGLLVAARVSSEEFGGGLLNLVATPMMVVSGVFFSMDGAPRVLQVAADLLPLTHLIAAARAVMLDGAGLAELAYPLTALTAMSAVYLALGAALFRWTPD